MNRNKVLTALFLLITHLVSLGALVLFCLGALVAVGMSFDSGITATTIIMDITLVVVPISILIIPSVISWRLWRHHHYRAASLVALINWIAMISGYLFLTYY